MEKAGAKPFKARGRVKVKSDLECQVGAADCVELWGCIICVLSVLYTLGWAVRAQRQ